MNNVNNFTRLDRIYTQINENVSLWKYYEYANIREVYPFQDLSNKDKAKEIIKNYFNAGGKIELLNDEVANLARFSNLRAEHTLSTFLLGIYFYNNVELIKLSFENFAQDDPYITWLYIWYLSCLYHDIGYIFENDSNYSQRTLKEILEIEPSEGLNGLKYCDLAIKYYNYRKKFGKIDHGVVGGGLLYTKLNNVMASNCNDNHPEILYGLLFSKDLEKYYKKAADAIIRHNMWNCSSSNIEKHKEYQENELGKLIYERISFKDPFAFLLGLCDSIEPIKKFEGATCRQVLENIELKAEKNTITIKVSESNILDCKKYFEPLTTLKDWLDVIVVPDSESNIKSVGISLPSFLENPVDF